MTATSHEGEQEPFEFTRNLHLTPEVQRGLISDAINRIATPEFEDSFVQIEVAETEDAIRPYVDSAWVSANHASRSIIRLTAVSERTRALKRPHSPKDEKTREFQDKMREVSNRMLLFPSEHDWSAGDEFAPTRQRKQTMRASTRAAAVVSIDLSDQFNEDVQALFEACDETETWARTQVARIRAELVNRMFDPDFLTAADAWVNTPDSRFQEAKADPNIPAQPHIGRNGTGYNGGIIHMIEYWASPEKRNRFERLGTEMTVDDFIKVSNEYRGLLENARTLTDGETYILKDSMGNLRYYLLRPEPGGNSNGPGVFVVGFANHKDGIPRLASIIPLDHEDHHYFYDRVKDCREGNDRGELNRMVGKGEIVYETPRYYDYLDHDETASHA